MAAALATTTIPSATTSMQNKVTLAASPTGLAKGWLIVADAECMLVQAPVAAAANTWQVLRGYHGTPATAHKAAVSVYVGPPSYFWAQFNRSGACNAATEIALPSINLRAGNHFNDNSGEWQQTKINGVSSVL
jgi:hypothetical protein